MQTIVVSGASKGIGFQICLKAAAEGNKVIALSRNIESLSNIENIHPFAVDLLNHKEIVGFYEQEFHPSSNEVELINMGILKDNRGQKLGSTLLLHAISNAFNKNPNRMWVHTCSLDHKHALNNYIAKGFKIFKEEQIDFVV